MARRRKGLVRSALTLIELLVSLGIILLFIALLVPAVQKVREAGNRAVCQNNLHQLAIAAHNYHVDHGKFPPGYLGPIPNDGEMTDVNGPHVGVMPYLLPYLEQDNLGKLITISLNPKSTGFPWWQDVLINQLALNRLEVFRCPSMEKGDATKGTAIAVHFYHITAGPRISAAVHPYGGGTHPFGHSNYVGVNGAAGKGTDPTWALYEGILGNRTEISLGEVTARDGTSNTLLFGEFAGGVNTVQSHFTLSWMGVGAFGTFMGMPYHNQSPSAPPGGSLPPPGQPGGGSPWSGFGGGSGSGGSNLFGNCGCGQHGVVTPIDGFDVSNWFVFSSRHPRVVNFAFADGGVRPLHRGMTSTWQSSDWYVLQQLAGRGDGTSVDVGALLD